MPTNDRVTVIGAGPAGLTAAYELARHGISGTIVEATDSIGGLSQTAQRDGYRFDLGGHRFFTKAPEVDALWDEMLGEPMLVRQRMSRIYYDGKFYDYPLRATNALRNLGIVRATQCVTSYLAARAHPIANPHNYQEWVVNQFGQVLFETFFKAYTEKVWGVPCTQISADWAAQRIKGLNLKQAISQSLFGKGKTVVTSLIDRFRYPALGPGQLWEKCAATLQQRGWELLLNHRVVGVELDQRVRKITVEDPQGNRRDLPTAHLFSSMALRDLVAAMHCPVPAEVAHAASTLTYRDFLTVALVLDAAELFPDNWIYIHSPQVKMGRIQNFKNWSPRMVPDPATTCLGLEYFVNQGDATWNTSDRDLIEQGYRELQTVGLSRGQRIKGFVLRVPMAYPTYGLDYAAQVGSIRQWLEKIPNLACIGRNGQHRYNNQDHSMVTALIAARNLALGENRNPWSVNQDAQYHEGFADAPSQP